MDSVPVATAFWVGGALLVMRGCGSRMSGPHPHQDNSMIQCNSKGGPRTDYKNHYWKILKQKLEWNLKPKQKKIFQKCWTKNENFAFKTSWSSVVFSYKHYKKQDNFSKKLKCPSLWAFSSTYLQGSRCIIILEHILPKFALLLM